jgi:hypothetical protein
MQLCIVQLALVMSSPRSPRSRTEAIAAMNTEIIIKKIDTLLQNSPYPCPRLSINPYHFPSLVVQRGLGQFMKKRTGWAVSVNADSIRFHANVEESHANHDHRRCVTCGTDGITDYPEDAREAKAAREE